MEDKMDGLDIDVPIRILQILTLDHILIYFGFKPLLGLIINNHY